LRPRNHYDQNTFAAAISGGQRLRRELSKLFQCARTRPARRTQSGGPHFLDSQGSCWTAAYINEGGNVVRDLRANIAAEAGARQTYEALIKGMRRREYQKGNHPPADARDHARERVH
jgi:hypothetical protein